MVKGIHHITAIASDPQRCFDFYTKTLGLRLTKKSINQDQVEAYHLFFGDSVGAPGMDLTFFTFLPALPSIPGVGQVSRISLAIPKQSFSFWRDRLERCGVMTDILCLYGLDRIRFTDPDGLGLELVAVEQNEFSKGAGELWESVDVSLDKAIGYFYSATLAVVSRITIEPILLLMGYRVLLDEGVYVLYTLPNGERAIFLEISEQLDDDLAVQGSGSVHHIAFEVEDERALLAARETLLLTGLYPTEVIDRHYFKSVYFRTASQILFELATSGPGFTVDEEKEHLGERLSIPPFLESKRPYIESLLPEITP